MTRVPDTVRERVRQRATKRCEYCRKPDAFRRLPYHVDHIIPVKRHRGSTGLENLAWACVECNTTKGSDIASYDEITGDLTPLFNPRRQKWDDHFELEEATIVGKTPIGRVTVYLLEMNHYRQVEARSYIINAAQW
jgi:hypothetical protein